MNSFLYDTSTLLALFVDEHPNHDKTIDLYIDHKSDGKSLFIANHTLAEFFRHITSGRQYFIYDSEQARNVIAEDIVPNFQSIPLLNNDYAIVIDTMKKLSLEGPVIYDGLIARASKKVKADGLVTYNIKDFKRVWPLTDADLIEP